MYTFHDRSPFHSLSFLFHDFNCHLINLVELFHFFRYDFVWKFRKLCVYEYFWTNGEKWYTSSIYLFNYERTKFPKFLWVNLWKCVKEYLYDFLRVSRSVVENNWFGMVPGFSGSDRYSNKSVGKLFRCRPARLRPKISRRMQFPWLLDNVKHH